MTLRVPPTGHDCAGHAACCQRPGDADGGVPVNPFKPADRAAVERGAVVFDTYCVPCHGTTGEGDGLVVQRGFPAPPSLSCGQTPRR